MMLNLKVAKIFKRRDKFDYFFFPFMALLTLIFIWAVIGGIVNAARLTQASENCQKKDGVFLALNNGNGVCMKKEFFIQ